MTNTSVCRWAFISNFPRYAGGLRLSPVAHPGDGELDLCLLKRGNFWPGLRYLCGVAFGCHEQWHDVVVAKAHYVKIESNQPVPYQLDGDSGGWLPLEIHCLPRALPLIVP
jgi:diacylglycerol kinase family enzyme